MDGSTLRHAAAVDGRLTPGALSAFPGNAAAAGPDRPTHTFANEHKDAVMRVLPPQCGDVASAPPVERPVAHVPVPQDRHVPDLRALMRKEAATGPRATLAPREPRPLSDLFRGGGRAGCRPNEDDSRSNTRRSFTRGVSAQRRHSGGPARA